MKTPANYEGTMGADGLMDFLLPEDRAVYVEYIKGVPAKDLRRRVDIHEAQMYLASSADLKNKSHPTGGNWGLVSRQQAEYLAIVQAEQERRKRKPRQMMRA